MESINNLTQVQMQLQQQYLLYKRFRSKSPHAVTAAVLLI